MEKIRLRGYNAAYVIAIAFSFYKKIKLLIDSK